MWPYLLKVPLHAHNFIVHFSPLLTRHSSTLNVNVCIIAKCTLVYFYWDFFLQPVWDPRVPILPGQAYIVSRESQHDWPVRLGMDLASFFDMWSLKQPVLMPLGHIIILWAGTPATSWLPISPTPIGVLVVLTILWNRPSKMTGNLTSYSLKCWSTELSRIDCGRMHKKWLYTFSRYN